MKSTKLRVSSDRDRGIVTIVCEWVPHYRVEFFEALRDALRCRGVQLRIVYGEPRTDEGRSVVTPPVANGARIRNRYLPIGTRWLCWQPCVSLLRESDLVIVEQASKLLLNYLLVGRQVFGGLRVAMWGHGRKRQDNGTSDVGEVVKGMISRRPHWWFAYTEASAAAVRGLPFPPARITVVQNAIDTVGLTTRRAALTEEDLASFRDRTGIRSRNVAIYSGSLYREKRVSFLIEASEHLREAMPDFELIIIGSGPDRALVEAAARKFPWIHYPGAVFGAEKVLYFRLAKAMVVPGVVGLCVLDSFALEVPLVAIDLDGHGPEIDYLCDKQNGLKLPRDTGPRAYASAVQDLMTDEVLLKRLQDGGRIAAQVYTLEAMVDRFAAGILRALASDGP